MKHKFILTLLLFFILFHNIFPAKINLKCGGVVSESVKLNPSHTFYLNSKIEIIFDSSVDPSYYSYFINFFNQTETYISHFYGENPSDIPLTIKYDPTQKDWFFYNKEENAIIISAYPTRNYRVDNDHDGKIDEDPFNGIDDDGDGLIDEDYNNDPQYDQLLLHEFIHSFHRDLNITTPWIEEGMTECCTELISEYLYQGKIKDIRGRNPQKNIFLFDLLEENNFLSSHIGFLNSVIPEYYYDYSTSVFLLLCSSYANSNDIYQFSLLKTINETLRNVDCSQIDTNTFYAILDNIFGEKKVDGFPLVSDFLKSLSLNCEKNSEISLVLLPIWTKYNDNWYFTTVNPMNLTYFLIKRYKDDSGVEREEFITTNSKLKISLYKNDTLIFQKEYTIYPEVKNDWFYDTRTLSDGVYRLEGEISLEDGKEIRKRVHFIVSHKESTPYLLNNLEKGFGLILLNRDKYAISSKPSTTQEVEDICNFEGGGIFSSETNIDEVSLYVKNLKIHVTIPSPFSRVVIKKISQFYIPLRYFSENSFVGVTIINRHTFSLNSVFSLYDSEGNIFECTDCENFENPIFSDIEGKSEKIFIVKDLFNTEIPEDGYMTISSEFPVECFYMKGDYEGTFLGGITPQEMPTSKFYIPFVKVDDNYSTFINLINPHDSEAIVTLFLIDEDGNTINFSDPITLYSFSDMNLNLEDIFPEITNSCYVKVKASNTILSEISNFNGENLSLVKQINDPSHTFTIPHIAIGNRYYTKLHILSLENEESADIYISIYDSEGNEILKDLLLTTVNAGCKKIVNISDIIPPYNSDFFDGWIRIKCSKKIILYAEIGDNNSHFQTIQSPFTRLSRFLYFNHIANGEIGEVNYFTGLSLSNPNPVENSVEIKIYDGTNGEPIYDSTFVIPPNGRFISLIGSDELFPDCDTMGTGYIDIRAEYKIAGYEIFGDNSLNFLSSVPPFLN